MFKFNMKWKTDKYEVTDGLRHFSDLDGKKKLIKVYKREYVEAKLLSDPNGYNHNCGWKDFCLGTKGKPFNYF